MVKNNLNMSDAELDHALNAAEAAPEGQALKALGRNISVRPGFVARLEAELKESASIRVRGFPLPKLSWPARRALRIAAALALIVLVGGLIWLDQPMRVSAQEVLDRASAPQMEPNQVEHRVYTVVYTEDGSTTPQQDIADVWVQSDETGAVTETALTYNKRDTDGNIRGIIHQLYTGDKLQMYFYDTQENTVIVRTATRDEMLGAGPDYFDGVSAAKYLNEIRAGNVDGVTLLPEQDFHGAPALPVRTEHKAEALTVYFDPQTYVMRGMQSPNFEMWLETEEVVAPADVPANTFNFEIPEGAQVAKPDEAPTWKDDPSLQALAEACNLTLDTLAEAGKAGQSILAACQASNPDITEEQLIEVVINPLPQDLDGKVAAGAMSGDEANEILANARRKASLLLNAPFTVENN